MGSRSDRGKEVETAPSPSGGAADVAVGVTSFRTRLILDGIVVVAFIAFGTVMVRVISDASKRQRRQNAELLALHGAGVDVTAELSLDAVLNKVVERARILVEARYGARSVVNNDGSIQTFFTSGVTAEQRTKIGPLPWNNMLARTATNIRSGGRTPLAGIVHALTLMLILVFAGQWAAKVPLASLAAILVLVAYHMSEWRSFAGLLRAPKSDIFVLIVTFALTVFVDLTVAVQVGVVASSLLFMRRMAEVTNIEGVSGEMSDASAIDDPDSITLGGRVIPKASRSTRSTARFSSARRTSSAKWSARSKSPRGR
jgi:hypothetical protein